MKECRKCKVLKENIEFCKNKKQKDGLNIYCKQCVKERQQKYTDNGRCCRCGRIIINKSKKTCEYCRNIWGYNIKLVLLKDIPNCAGNYVLYFKETKGVYIGASCNLKDRILGHYRKLDKNKHENQFLQQDFNHYPKRMLIGISCCGEQDIYENEEKIWFTLKQKKIFNIYNQQKPRKNKLLRLTDSKINKLLSKIIKENGGCWIYNGHVAKDGYCYIDIDKESFPVHRVIYTIYKRQESQNETWNIPNNLLIRHICHNKKCCNPEHLLLGTDKDNCNDSKGQIRNKRKFTGQLVVAWGETKTLGEWMLDIRKNSELCINTIRSRLKTMSPEDALSKPLFKKHISEQARKDRIHKRLLRQQENKKKFEIGATIRQLYDDGEHIDDLMEYFNIKKSDMLLIISNKKWYNPSVVSIVPKDYIRQQRRLPPKNVILDQLGYYKDNQYGIHWDDGYYRGYIYMKYGKSINVGKHKNVNSYIKRANEICIENGLPQQYAE